MPNEQYLIKLKLNKDNYDDLKEQAENLGITVQEFIKIKTLSNYILNPIEACRRAMEPAFQKKYKGKTFELPDLYTTDEWPYDSRGQAGAFGKNFFNYVYKNEPGNIRYVDGGHNGKRAIYTLI